MTPAVADAAKARELAAIADLLPCGTSAVPLAATGTAPGAAGPESAGNSCPIWRGATAGPPRP